MLKRANINPTTVNIDTLKTEYKKLIQGKNDLNSNLKNYQKELNELDLIKQNMEQYFNTNIEKETTKDKNHSHSNQEQ